MLPHGVFAANPSPSDIDGTYWEQVAQTRWGRYLTALERRAVEKGSSVTRHPTTALDIGSEGGRWADLLSKKGWAVTCTDIDSEMLELCKRRIPNADCVLMRPDDTRFPCEAETIGLLLCVEVPPVDSAWFVDEAYRVLKTGGVLVGTAQNRLSYRAFLHCLCRRRPWDRGCYQVYYHRLRNRMLRRGFTLVHQQGCCWPPFARASDSTLVPFFGRLEKYAGLRRLASISPWVIFVAQK